jgi:hypothetical protein
MRDRHFDPWDLLQPLAAMIISLITMHIVIALCLPLRWQVIRLQIAERLENRLREELEQHYHQLLTDVTNEVLAERRQNEHFLKEIAEVASWLEEREQAASIVHLYGK